MQLAKRLLSFLTIIAVLLSSLYYSQTQLLLAADSDNDYDLTQYTSSEEAHGEYSVNPIGGVAKENFIRVEWDDNYTDAESEGIPELGKGRSTGDDPQNDASSEIIESTDSPNASYATKTDGSGTYGYQSLTVARKAIYDALDIEVKAFISSDKYSTDLTADKKNNGITAEASVPTSDAAFSMDDIRYAVTAFRYDNPQYYFITGTIIGYTFSSDNKTVRVTLYVDEYYCPYEVRRNADQCIQSVGNVWISELKSILAGNPGNGQSVEYLAAVRAHDLIISKINYAYNSSNKPEDAWWAHCLAGVFTEEGVVCEGYARAYQYLLNMCGIDNVYIVGMADTSEGRGGHAWNSICLDGKWYLVDITWDDKGSGNGADKTDEVIYSYFAIPAEQFSKDHTPDNMGNEGMYALPTFDNGNDYTYYRYFKGYGNDYGTLTESAALELYNLASVAKPSFTDYLYFSVKDTKSGSVMLSILNENSVRMYADSYFGYIFRVKSIKINNPSKTIKLDTEKLELAINQSATVTAEIDSGSDDRVVFSVDNSKYCSVTPNGNAAVIVGKRNGIAKLTATTISGSVSTECEIIVGTGDPEPDGVEFTGAGGTIWENGKKEYKTIQLETSLSASTWEDSKGKAKTGKLVWIASDKKISPQFNKTKHTLTTKCKSTKGTVNNKGIVTAKKTGIIYIYCCDTGSFNVEQFIVEVLASPNKLILGDSAGIKDAKEGTKKYFIEVGDREKIYISGLTKTGWADESCDYTAELAKSEYDSYFSVSKVQKDDDGDPYFTVTALDINREKGKAVSAKVNVICTQSGKKGSVTVVSFNPVQGASATAPNAVKNTLVQALVNKGDTITCNLNLITNITGVSDTTDKIKLVISGDGADVDEKHIIKEGKTSVKLKYNKNDKTIELKASKDAGLPAVVTLIVYNPQYREYTFCDSIIEVDEEGNVSFSD